MAVIITPANMDPAWPDAVKIAVRLAISLGLLYVGVNRGRKRRHDVIRNLLPGSNDIKSASVRAGFDNTHQKADCTQLSIGFTGGAAHGEGSPDNNHSREIYPRWNDLNGNAVRYLTNCIASRTLEPGILILEHWWNLPSSSHSQEHIVVCAAKIESLLKTGDLVNLPVRETDHGDEDQQWCLHRHWQRQNDLAVLCSVNRLLKFQRCIDLPR